MPDVIGNVHYNYAQSDWSPDFSSSKSTSGPLPMYPYMGPGGPIGLSGANNCQNNQQMSPDISYLLDGGSTGRFTPSSTTYSEYQTVPGGSFDTLV